MTLLIDCSVAKRVYKELRCDSRMLRKATFKSLVAGRMVVGEFWHAAAPLSSSPMHPYHDKHWKKRQWGSYGSIDLLSVKRMKAVIVERIIDRSFGTIGKSHLYLGVRDGRGIDWCTGCQCLE
jgi:hypothetical protein